MSRLFLSVPRAKHVLGVLAAALALVFAITLVPSGTAGVLASSATCDPAKPHASGAFAGETILTLDGLTRVYILHIPTSYDGTEAVPLVFSLHSFATIASFQDTFSEVPLKGEAEGFIVVTPQGTLNSGGTPHWNSSQLPAPEPDDVAFISELLTAMETLLCVDSTRVYSTGLSNGAFMSSRLACSIPDRIAAIAPVAGAAYFGDCTSTPVPVIAFHGTGDPIVDFGPIESTAIPSWATHNGCGAPTVQDPLPGTVGVRLIRYAGCDDDATVDFYVVFDADPGTVGEQGGGHTWPGSGYAVPAPLEAILGPTTQEISANDLMWDFFVASAPTKPASVGGVTGDSALRPLGAQTVEANGAPWAVAAGIAAAASAMAVVGGAWYARRRRA